MTERTIPSHYGKKVSPQCERAIADRAGGQWGIVTVEELRAMGLSDRAVVSRVERGHLHRLYQGVYSVGNPNPPWEAWMLAAVRACGDRSFLSHVPGAMLLGILEGRVDVTPEVTVVGPRAPRVAGIRGHRVADLPPEDRWTWRGVPVLSPARLLLNLAGRLSGRPLRSAVRRAQGKGRVTVREIVALIARVGPVRGSRRLADVVATGPAPTRSVLEDVVLDLLLDAGFEHPEVNRPLIVDGQRVIPDFRWPDQRLVVEADGAVWHDQPVAREDDARRQALLEANGERVVRVTWEQAVARRGQTVRRIEAAGAPRVASSA